MKSAWLKSLLPALRFFVLFPGFAFAAHTDVIVFDNGDRLTGEVKSLQRGKRNFKTEATGTIGIEWENVAFLNSNQNLQVETSDGELYLGTLQTSDKAGELMVLTDSGLVSLEDNRVVHINPVDQKNWRDWDVDVSAGYNFTSANNVTQGNIGVDAKRRTTVRILSLSYSAMVSDSSDNEPSENQDLTLNWTKLRANHWTNTGTLAFTQNTQLGLNLRSSIGWGIGKILVDTNHSGFALGAGLKVSEEDSIEVEENTTSLEAYGKLQWDWFHYDSPEWDLSTEFELIPSLTEQGRVRYEFDTTIKWEIFKDFYWTVEIYDNFDNQSKSEGAAKHDYGVITSVTYDLK
jgi:hypothetical protein